MDTNVQEATKPAKRRKKEGHGDRHSHSQISQVSILHPTVMKCWS